MTKIIYLTRGYSVIVDDDDYDRLMEVKWQASIHSNGFAYARGKPSIDGYKVKSVLMHRFILNAKNGMLVDHINRDTLDNRKDNLRLCSETQNQGNTNKRMVFLGKDSLSRFKGVTWLPRNKKWMAYLGGNKNREYLGIFKREEDAALAYNFAALKYFGEFANFNKTEKP